VRSINEVEALLNAAGDASGSHRLELLERAVQTADALGDVELGFQARDELMQVASLNGRPELLFSTFAWMLGQFDAGRVDDFEEDNLLWQYKWVINNLWEFPSITKAQIEGAFADFSARLERGGYNQRTAHYFRWKFEHHRGDHAAADAARDQWQRMPQDALSDCSACEAHFETVYSAWLRDDERTLQLAAPILSGRLSCAEVPETTLSIVLMPMLRLGQHNEAIKAHKRGYRLTRDNPEFLTSVAGHIEFLAFVHQSSAALKLFERHLAWALDTQAPERRFAFYCALQPLWLRLREAQVDSIKLRLPKAFALYNANDTYPPSELEQYFRKELEQVASQFDARNGTNEFTRSLNVDLELLERTPPIALEQRRVNAKPSSRSL
jgi:hypothetical protein